ncbi:MAG: hypothetical protein Q8R63_00155 [Ramlibacter sp.]|nr:hypothetical protein [Ramlibacter sp.]
MRALLRFFSIPGVVAPSWLREIIDRKLKISPLIEAAGSLAASLSAPAVTADPKAFIAPLLLAREHHAEMKAMGVRLVSQGDEDTVAPHANLKLIAARSLIANVPASVFAGMNRGDLRLVQDAFRDLEINPGPTINAAIAKRLAPPGRPAPRVEAGRPRDRFAVPDGGLDEDGAVIPSPHARQALAETDGFLARVARIEASGGTGVSGRAALQFDGLRDNIQQDFEVTGEEAAALVIDGLATRTQTPGGLAQIKTLLQHLPPAELEQIATSQPTGHIVLAHHVELIDLVNDAWEARAKAAGERFDAAVAQLLAAEPEKRLESLSAAIAAHTELMPWGQSPRDDSLDLLSGGLANQGPLISRLGAGEIAALKSMNLGINAVISRATAQRVNDLTFHHSGLWLDGLTRLRAGQLKEGILALRQAINLSAEINRCHHLVAGTPVTQDSSRDLHNLLMQEVFARLSVAQKADFKEMMDRLEIRELISVLEVPYNAASTGGTSEQASLRNRLADDLKLFAAPGTQYYRVRVSAEAVAAVEQVFTSDVADTPVAPVGALTDTKRPVELAAADSNALKALQHETANRWSSAMSALGAGHLQSGLAQLKAAVSLADEVAQLQAQQRRPKGAASEAARQAVVTQMQLSSDQRQQFARALNRPEVRELYAALAVVATFAPELTNPALPLMRRLVMDLILIREQLSLPPFQLVTVSVQMRNVVITGFGAELGYRGERLATTAFENHSPIRPTRLSPSR